MVAERDLNVQTTGTIDPTGHAVSVVECNNDVAAAYLVEDLQALPYPPAFGVEWRERPRVMVQSADLPSRLIMHRYGMVTTRHDPFPLLARYEAHGLEAQP